MSGIVQVDENRLGKVEQELSGVKSDINHTQSDIGEIKQSQQATSEQMRVISEAVVKLTMISEQNQSMLPKLEEESKLRAEADAKLADNQTKNREWQIKIMSSISVLLFLITMFSSEIKTLLFGHS